MSTIFRAMADPIRQRLLEVLSRQELSVSELVEVLGLPQSTVSRHLKVLREAGLVVDRRVGAAVLHAAGGPGLSRREGGFSSAGAGALPAGASPRGRAGQEGGRSATAGPDAAGGSGQDGRPAVELRERLLEWAVHEPLDEHIRERMRQVVRRRHTASNDFFERIGTRWDQLRREAFGEAFHLEALSALLPYEWTVADIGSGTGYLLPALAARFHRVIAVEPAGAMLEAARGRPEVKAVTNIEFREGSLDRLPLESGEADLAIASLVVHHVPSPPGALKELRRVVRNGGRLLVIEQHEHGNDRFHERMGDYWRGFAPPDLQAWTQAAGFADIRISPLAHVKPGGRQTGKVPALYTLTARAV